MKIYCFYLVRKHISPKKYKAVIEDEIVSIGDNECVLYAYTPEKSSETQFLSTRNMELFFEKIIDMNREDYEYFYDHHTDQVLEFNTFNAKKIEDGRYKSYSTQVLSTRAEADHILYYKEELVLDIISDFLPIQLIDYLELHPLKKKLRHILNDFFLYSDIISKVHPMEDINYDTFIVDDLSLYIKLFSNTFKTR